MTWAYRTHGDGVKWDSAIIESGGYPNCGHTDGRTLHCWRINGIETWLCRDCSAARRFDDDLFGRGLQPIINETHNFMARGPKGATRMKVYLAGPMRGHPEFNYPLFNEVTHVLRAKGWTVASPAEHDLQTTPAIVHETGYATGDPNKTNLFDTRSAFRWDFKQIVKADAIVLLPGWEGSQGARSERLVAEHCGKLVLLAKRTQRCSIHPGPCQPECLTWTTVADTTQARMTTHIVDISGGLLVRNLP